MPNFITPSMPLKTYIKVQTKFYPWNNQETKVNYPSFSKQYDLGLSIW